MLKHNPYLQKNIEDKKIDLSRMEMYDKLEVKMIVIIDKRK